MPITIGPFNNVPAPGSPIKSDWPQQISQYAWDTRKTADRLFGYPVARQAFRGTVSTNASGDFAFNTGYTPITAIGIGAQSGSNFILVNTLLDSTQCVFKVIGIPSGSPVASTIVNVAYVVFALSAAP